MASVRLDIPESQVLALVQQLSPVAKQAVLQMLIPELVDALDELEVLVDFDEPPEFWEEPELWDEEEWDEEEWMDRRQLLAAETFHYSYANYDNHLGIGNIRFDKLMPDDVDTLERAEQEGWDDARLAQALEVDEEHVEHWRRSYQRAKAITDASTPAESFRRGVRFSIEDAIEEGLTDEQQIDDLVTQICYRAADLAYLLDMRGELLSEYSAELREV
jgi:hypothetical protein